MIEINGAAEQRLAMRQDRIRPLVDEFKTWMRTERARLSHGTPTSPGRWITPSSAGRPSPAFSTTVAPVCRTMPQSENGEWLTVDEDIAASLISAAIA
jgi:hypothetical protein